MASSVTLEPWWARTACTRRRMVSAGVLASAAARTSQVAEPRLRERLAGSRPGLDHAVGEEQDLVARLEGGDHGRCEGVPEPEREGRVGRQLADHLGAAQHQRVGVPGGEPRELTRAAVQRGQGHR